MTDFQFEVFIRRHQGESFKSIVEVNKDNRFRGTMHYVRTAFDKACVEIVRSRTNECKRFYLEGIFKQKWADIIMILEDVAPRWKEHDLSIPKSSFKCPCKGTNQ